MITMLWKSTLNMVLLTRAEYVFNANEYCMKELLLHPVISSQLLYTFSYDLIPIS